MQPCKMLLLLLFIVIFILHMLPKLNQVSSQDPVASLKDIWHQDMGPVMIGAISSFSMKLGPRSDSTKTQADPFYAMTNKFPPNASQSTNSNINGFKPLGNKSDRLHLKDSDDEIGLDNDNDDGDEHEMLCNFQGKQIRVAVSPQPPLVNCQQDLYGDWLCNGSNIELINVLERRMNFQANWIVLANNHFDEVDTRGAAGAASNQLAMTSKQGRGSSASQPSRSSGIFGLVGTGRALLSANGVMRTLDRQRYNLLVSEPFDSFKLHFLLSKSVRDHDHIFVKPFDLQAWLAIFLSAALVVPVFYLINSTSSHYALQDDKELASISCSSCARHWLSRLAHLVKDLVSHLGRRSCGRGRRRSSHDSSASSSSSIDCPLDEQVERMIQSSSKEPWVPMKQLNICTTATTTKWPRGNRRRQRRLVRRQWCLERRRARKMSQIKRRSGFSRVAYIVWYVVASLANQGGETEDLPHASSTRILVAFWWLYLIVICAIHSGILTAILTFPKQIDFIQTLDDYLQLAESERNGIKIAIDKFSELAHLLADRDNLHKSPLQQLEQNSVPMVYVDFQRHRQRILDDIQLGHSALIEEKSVVTQIITQEYLDSRQTKCLFKASRYPVDIIPMSLILSPKMSSSCVRQINLILRRVMITGLAQKWRRKYDSQGNDCLNSVIMNVGDVDKIELKHVTLAFWLLGLGILVGLMFLISEIVWLFMIEGEEEEDDDELADSESYLSCSSSSESSDGQSDLTSASSEMDVQLGHRRAIQAPIQKRMPMRSLQRRRRPAKSLIRRVKRHQRVLVNRMMSRHKPMPQITFSADDNHRGEGEREEEDNDDDGATVAMDEGELQVGPIGGAKRNEQRQRRRLARAAERRSRRIQRTVDFIKRVHGGKIYSDKLRSRVRRASHAIVDTFIHSERNNETHCRLRNRSNTTTTTAGRTLQATTHSGHYLKSQTHR